MLDLNDAGKADGVITAALVDGEAVLKGVIGHAWLESGGGAYDAASMWPYRLLDMSPSVVPLPSGGTRSRKRA